MRAELLLAALLAAAPAWAGDEGGGVTFAARSSQSFPAPSYGAPARVLYDSGDSDPIASAWNTVLIQGYLPDPSVRFQAARASSSPRWTDMEVHRFPNGRFWARARLAEGSGAARLRALDAGISRDATVDIYSVEAFVQSPEAPPVPLPAPRGPVESGVARPFVHPRSEWKALPATEPYTPDPLPWRITLHHSDGRFTKSLAESLDEVRFIQDFHIHGRGWIDIAYHFAVDPLGNIIEARPEGTLGAHTLGNNEGNVGIVLLGTYHPPVNDHPTPAQLAAVAALGRYLVARYGIFPTALKGHRDYKITECPGDLAYVDLPQLRRALALPPAQAPAPSAPPSLRVPASFDGAR